MLEPNVKLGIISKNNPNGFWRFYSIIIIKPVRRFANLDYSLHVRF
jgi:hypothetical protein